MKSLVLLVLLLSGVAQAFQAGDKVEIYHSRTGFYDGCTGLVANPAFTVENVTGCTTIIYFKYLTCQGREIEVDGHVCANSLRLVQKPLTVRKLK